ncbi:MAG TPA: aminotransferase class I/II-fold pyridoxal phosphate-dependent enzyme [Myxococcota bacterium]|nr:aminotransferase class I/II-fold pyridoxal phosphate-dependent enzyme [Myxococcota bacterium]
MKRHHGPSGREFNPETLALGLGYEPELSQGALKPPVFLTSTFQFTDAASGARFFELAYGLDEARKGEVPGLIYSRLNNPNLQMFEERIAAWDRTELGAVFASGMAAISTTLMALTSSGDHIISTAPVYGGTHFLLENVLPRFGIKASQVLGGTGAAQRLEQEAERVGPERVRMLFVETPANPSNALTDIAEVAELAQRLSARTGRRVLVAVDNTFLGPVFQRPAQCGADIVLYSATKFIGGHSDLVAGVATGPRDLMAEVMVLRTILGTMATPFTGWMLLRSLETVSIRMRRQAKNAQALAELLDAHPQVTKVHYPGLLQPEDPQHDIYSRQCTGPGSLIAFEVKGGKEAAWRVLDSFEVFRLAVSLGGTESLVEHPMSMTHADVPPEQLEDLGVQPGLIRMSAGIEHLSDLKRDLLHALQV